MTALRQLHLPPSIAVLALGLLHDRLYDTRGGLGCRSTALDNDVVINMRLLDTDAIGRPRPLRPTAMSIGW
jgi:hypothetical protein